MNMLLLRWTAIGLVGAALLAACGQADPTPTSTPTAAPAPTATTAPSDGPSGAELIVSMGCSGCHSLDSIPEATAKVGPDLSHIGGRADAAYIRESILDPNAVTASECPNGPCPVGLMPPMFGIIMSPEEIDTLVAYLAGLQ
ncbi:MAG: cytochrome c [Proteobacteria bacterium]|nr:cytochrome c [Pseudomonadota bacterium]